MLNFQHQRSPVVPLLFALLLAAYGCGDDDALTSESEADPSATVTDGQTSTTAGETAATCELPESDSPSQTAMITVRNNSDAPAFVLPKSDFSCNYDLLELELDGELIQYDHEGIYPVGCDERLCGYGCSDGGDQGLIINPGATASIPWNGARWVWESLSQTCVESFECEYGEAGDACQVRRLVGELQYTARVRLAELCPEVEGQCPCDGDVCEVFVYEPNYIETWKTFEAAATFPDGAAIVIE